ncbi:MAG: YdcF family protein [Candidatus Nanosyncoccaceae bacterium]|jgi:uncharacterized SAM-binding protein YcdF (DUF218 family)
MIKLIRGLISLAVLYAIVIVLFNTVLVPNDYRNCTLECLQPTVECQGRNIGCQKSDVIVVLSGGDTQARAEYGISLYRVGIADKILFVGAAAEDGSPSNASVMAALAYKSGVPVEAVLVEESSRNTCENAKKVKSVIGQSNLTRITLVTSAYHQRRALAEFKKNFDHKYDIFNAPLTQDKDWPAAWYASPNSWILASKEFFGWLRQLSGWDC